MRETIAEHAFRQMQGRVPNEAEARQVNNLAVFAGHCAAITQMGPGDEHVLSYGGGDVEITCHETEWSRTMKGGPWYAFQFKEGSTGEVSHVGNLYGALNAYAALWQLPTQSPPSPQVRHPFDGPFKPGDRVCHMRHDLDGYVVGHPVNGRMPVRVQHPQTGSDYMVWDCDKTFYVPERPSSPSTEKGE